MRFAARRRTLLAGLSVAAITIAGCNGNNDQAGTNVSTAKAPGGKTRQVAAILMQEDQFFRLNEMGMKSAAEQRGIELLTGNAHGALDQEINLVDTYASRGVQAILVSPLNPSGSAPALQRAAAKGIKVIAYNSMLDKPFVTAALRSDDVALGASTGKVAADYIRKKLGGSAKLAILHFSTHLADQGPLRPRGFRNEIKRLPGVQIVAEQEAWLAPDAERVTTDLLNAHPEINVIWAANEGATVGATTAVKNAGKAGKVVVFGTDISEQIASFLLSNDNILQAVTGQKPFEMGETTLTTAVQALDGQKVERLTIIPGQLYTRDKPAEVKAFQDKVGKLAP